MDSVFTARIDGAPEATVMQVSSVKLHSVHRRLAPLSLGMKKAGLYITWWQSGWQ